MRRTPPSYARSKPSEGARSCPLYAAKKLISQNSSLALGSAHLRSLFKIAGLKLGRTETQTGFPEDLHPVRMYWLLPAAIGPDEPPPGANGVQMGD